MRRDRQLFQAVDEDRRNERDQSGCCVRLDGSGCVQEPNDKNCQVRGGLCCTYSEHVGRVRGQHTILNTLTID